MNWQRILCWLTGHKWQIHETNVMKAMMLMHLHTMAGTRATCQRCNYEWNDLCCRPGCRCAITKENN